MTSDSTVVAQIQVASSASQQDKSFDAWIFAQSDPKPSRLEAIRHALANWLTGQGRVQNRDDPEGVN